jgi:hypothetical protein
MIFTRTYRYHSAMPVDDIKNRLLGKHMQVHNLDFEVSEKDLMLRIIPHAEQVTAIKTLPITHIEFKGNGDKTQVVISSKMRKIDSGGPTLVIAFCTFMLVGAILFFIFGKQEYSTFTYTLLGISLLIFIIFWMRMESGYFDYVRKIRDYIKTESKA